MRKHCKRKKVYAVLKDPVTHAIVGARLLDEKILNYLRQIELGSLEAFATGRATRNDWQVLADMCNVSEYLARNGAGAEALPDNLQAQAALEDCRTKRRFLFTGPQLQALRHAYEYADLQRQSVSLSRLEHAVRKVGEITRQKHKTKDPL